MKNKNGNFNRKQEKASVYTWYPANILRTFALARLSLRVTNIHSFSKVNRTFIQSYLDINNIPVTFAKC